MNNQESKIQAVIDAIVAKAPGKRLKEKVRNLATLLLGEGAGRDLDRQECARLQRERDEAMQALAHHDGRSWCAVCGFRNEECADKTPDCLGARARNQYPRKERT